MILRLKKMQDFKLLLHNKNIKHITLDSREVKEGSLFIALQGVKYNGNEFIETAIAKGASLVFCDNSEEVGDKSTIYYIENLKAQLAEIVKTIYVKTPKELYAVTGTNGKSSIIDLIRQSKLLLNENITTIGTLGVYKNNELIENLVNTTPDICKFFQILNENSNDSFAFEASSHGLEQERFAKLKLDTAIFTNLTRDHLDYHANMADYFAAKLKLFTIHLKKEGFAIINADDDYGAQIISICKAKQLKFFTYGKNANDLKLTSQNNELFTLKYQNQLYEFNTSLIGEFQIYNIMAVISLLLLKKIPMNNIIGIVEKFVPIKGRLEEVKSNKNYRVFIDYAHTPDALENILVTLKANCKNKLILLFGCGGERDQGKRSKMAIIADKYADITVVTDDNPRNEDAALIRAKIVKYLHNFYNIGERKAAIRHALAIAEKDDIVVLAGKGHENYQIIGEQKIHCDDYETVSELLNVE